MKVLFATDAGDNYVSFWEPMGPMMLTAICKASGHEVRFGPTKYSELSKIISEFKPDIIGFSVPTPYFSFLQRLNSKLKMHFNYISVFGGKHPTIKPEIIEQDSNIDVVAMGEADQTFPTLLDRIQNNQAYECTKGFWIRRDGQIFKNDRAEIVLDLDELPFMDREEIYNLVPYYKEYHVKGFLAGRGCPYDCSYCFNKYFRDLYGNYGNIIRRRSIEKLIEELKAVRSNYGMEMALFFDDVFSANKNWLISFCERYKQEINLPFAINHRLDFLDPQLISVLADAGLKTIFTAIEAGNPDVRAKLLKRPMSNDLILSRCRLFHENGINVVMQNIIGLPLTTLEDDLESYELNRKCNVDYAHSSVYQPYPGTELFNIAVQNNIFTQSTDVLHPKDYLKGRSRLKLSNRRSRERLNRIFSTALKLGISKNLVRVMIKLPLGFFYNILRIIVKTFTARSQIFPVNLPFLTKFRMGLRVLRSHI